MREKFNTVLYSYKYDKFANANAKAHRDVKHFFAAHKKVRWEKYARVRNKRRLPCWLYRCCPGPSLHKAEFCARQSSA